MTFFTRICEEESCIYTTMDYYLSALLLEMKLDQFVMSFEELYVDRDFIPHYYQQALFLYDKMHSSDKPIVVDEAMEEQWKAYEEEKNSLAGTVGEGNRMRRKFGDTYWWYYQY